MLFLIEVHSYPIQGSIMFISDKYKILPFPWIMTKDTGTSQNSTDYSLPSPSLSQLMIPTQHTSFFSGQEDQDEKLPLPLVGILGICKKNVPMLMTRCGGLNP